MRKGLLITLCLAFIAQTSILFAQQTQTRPPVYTPPKQNDRKLSDSNEFPPVVSPNSFSRRQEASSRNNNNLQLPKRMTRNDRVQYEAKPIQLEGGKVITFSDQRNGNGQQNGRFNRQVSYQEEVPVPSILGGKKDAQPSQTEQKQEPKTATQANELPAIPKINPVPPGNQLPKTNQQQLPNTNQQPATTNPMPAADSQQEVEKAPATTQPMQSNASDQDSLMQQNTPPNTGSELRQANPAHRMAALRSNPIPSSNTEQSDSRNHRLVSGITSREFSTEHGSTIRTEGPKLRVIAHGPSSIGIGKPARYEVVIHNDDRTTANDLIVGIDIPNWIDVNNVNTTQGTRELSDGSTDSRLVWSVKQIAAGTTEKLILDVIPRQAKMFDLHIEWTVMPISGIASVQVTEPRLDIEISGPNEVEFGQNVLYKVTVSNPGTGVAENVNVMLPEALGGERANLGNIEPGHQREIQVELTARHAGTIDLATTATADGDLRQTDSRNITVRRAALEIAMGGPQMKYAGSVGTYQVIVKNTGDAIAQNVVAAMALPGGVDYVSGIEGVEQVQGGIRWNVGTLSPGAERSFHINCQLNRAGTLNFEIATRGDGDLASTGRVETRVEAIADLVLSVEDPKGPLPTGQDIPYQIRVKNRGSKVARGVKLVMQFSEGIEPTNATGHQNQMEPGQVRFNPIDQIEPGQEVVLKVLANASQTGTHTFRAQLICEESDSREIAEGTTRFYSGNGSTSEENFRSSQSQDYSSGGSFRK